MENVLWKSSEKEQTPYFLILYHSRNCLESRRLLKKTEKMLAIYP